MAAFFLTVTATAAENVHPRWLRANHLMGLTVENVDGGKIGSFRNIAIDPRSGRICYVILAPNGIFASRTRLRAVPPELVFTATAKRNVVGVRLTLADWDRAPVLSPADIDELGKSSYRERAAQFYRKWSSSAGESPAEIEDIQLADDVIGKSLVNRDQKKLGEIIDLLVMLNPDSPVLAVFSTGKLLDGRARAFAVPLSVLSPANGKLVLNADRKALLAARPLGREAMKPHRGTESPPIFSYALND